MYSSPSGPGLITPPHIGHEKRYRDPRHPVAIHSACRGVMPPCPPDDQLRRSRRRVRSPSRGASKVDVIVGPERPRHIVTVGITCLPYLTDSDETEYTVLSALLALFVSCETGQ